MGAGLVLIRLGCSSVSGSGRSCSVSPPLPPTALTSLLPLSALAFSGLFCLSLCVSLCVYLSCFITKTIFEVAHREYN